MGCEDFFLLFKNVANFFLKSKILLSNIIVFQSWLHDVDIFFYLFLVNFIHLCMNFFLDLVVKFLILFLTIYSVAFHVISSIFLRLIDKWEIWLLLFSWIWSTCIGLLFLSHQISLYLLFLRRCFLFLFRVDTWIIRKWWCFLFRNWTFILISFTILLFFNVFQTLYFLNMFFRHLILNIFVLFSDIVFFIQHFMHLWIVFQPVSISQGI